ncbi:sulfurtransferase complex subunit TusD [Buchnera aphidicola (Pemphigus obesinymphae)]|uniref:sulfurtransferase complex subunit TusD n=1 Tax=Buchnera aphidicola TaxID=9 RepID=UPI0022377327|nr:sulfurtransferase complex subunit TusD [Buchnera aphidicola]MCW5196429.1 sulfurtransferase complex subunit TusD [Buchnera aphidicola (Pemphigus obesinymphae)]
MNYLVIVTGSAYGKQNSRTALFFSRALIDCGHKLDSIFFYFSGVLNANKMVSPAEDEFNLVNSWQDFHSQFNIKLNICISAAARRGVISDEQALRFGIQIGNLAKGFTLTGLGELSESIRKCDRVVQF